MSAGINRDEWLAAVREVEPQDDQDALTLKEMGELFGTKKDATRKRAEALVAQGRAVRVFKKIAKVSGCAMAVPAYRLVKPAKKGK